MASCRLFQCTIFVHFWWVYLRTCRRPDQSCQIQFRLHFRSPFQVDLSVSLSTPSHSYRKFATTWSGSIEAVMWYTRRWCIYQLRRRMPTYQALLFVENTSCTTGSSWDCPCSLDYLLCSLFTQIRSHHYGTLLMLVLYCPYLASSLFVYSWCSNNQMCLTRWFVTWPHASGSSFKESIAI